MFRRTQMTAAMSQELMDELSDHRRRGLNITTALMESTINRINHRIKRTEKFWRDGPNPWSNSPPTKSAKPSRWKPTGKTKQKPRRSVANPVPKPDKPCPAPGPIQDGPVVRQTDHSCQAERTKQDVMDHKQRLDSLRHDDRRSKAPAFAERRVFRAMAAHDDPIAPA